MDPRITMDHAWIDPLATHVDTYTHVATKFSPPSLVLFLHGCGLWHQHELSIRLLCVWGGGGVEDVVRKHTEPLSCRLSLEAWSTNQQPRCGIPNKSFCTSDKPPSSMANTSDLRSLACFYSCDEVVEGKMTQHT